MSGVFDAYARYYDLLYRDKDYGAEAGYVVARLRERLSASAQILELGCGTGAHAEHLARAGHTVHGVDISTQMIERAAARRSQLSPDVAARLSFASGDVRTVRTGQTYDAVISLFHVVSYQTTNDDLDATFRTAAAHLRPGGVFLFDFWYGPAVLLQRPELRVKRLEDESVRITRLAEPRMQANENVVEVNYTVFVEDKASARVEQIRETHRMRYLFLPELARCAGTRFSLYDSAAWMTTRPLAAVDWSGCVRMVRRAEAKP